jgi:hypothetical protein
MYTSITEIESTRVIRSIILGVIMIVLSFGGLFVSISIVRAERGPSREAFLQTQLTSKGETAIRSGSVATEILVGDYTPNFQSPEVGFSFSPSDTLQFVTDMVSDMIPDFGGECGTAKEAAEFGVEICQ